MSLSPSKYLFGMHFCEIEAGFELQVITAVVAHCTRGMPPISLRSKCKTSPESFGAVSGESFVEFCGGDMATGLMDKAQYGNYGLVHSVQVGALPWALKSRLCQILSIACCFKQACSFFDLVRKPGDLLYGSALLSPRTTGLPGP